MGKSRPGRGWGGRGCRREKEGVHAHCWCLVSEKTLTSRRNLTLP